MATPILFFRALWKHVGAVVTTSLVLCAGVGWLEHYYGSLSWPIYTGILGGLFVIGCYRAWLDEYRQRQALEDWQRPKLEIVFRPAVYNRSDRELSNIRVVLEWCSPEGQAGVFLDHAFKSMDRGTEYVTIAPELAILSPLAPLKAQPLSDCEFLVQRA